ncbi:MAG: hypothetical protein M3070_05680 [Actinomycetota bacterium]|nr:hypothetical protein [Actinomycetota bacterium]
MSLRNVGDGIAVLHGWVIHPEQVTGERPHPPPSEFRPTDPRPLRARR